MCEPRFFWVSLNIDNQNIILVSSYCEALYRNYRAPTKSMVLVVEGSLDKSG